MRAVGSGGSCCDELVSGEKASNASVGAPPRRPHTRHPGRASERQCPRPDGEPQGHTSPPSVALLGPASLASSPQAYNRRIEVFSNSLIARAGQFSAASSSSFPTRRRLVRCRSLSARPRSTRPKSSDRSAAAKQRRAADRCGMAADRVSRPAESLEIRAFPTSQPSDVRRCGQSSALRGFAAPGGLGWLFPVRDERGMKRSRRSFASRATAKDADLQVLYGSDGTRTRDLRRDRPVMAVPG
jgi:hypothetical protein